MLKMDWLKFKLAECIHTQQCQVILLIFISFYCSFKATKRIEIISRFFPYRLGTQMAVVSSLLSDPIADISSDSTSEARWQTPQVRFYG